jgi:NitT/TauT family transport system ATP-binding protein
MSNPSVLLDVSGLQKRYTDGTLAVQEITLNVREREFVSIVGPSGCGKTTLLKTICALLGPTKGTVKLNGTLITEPPPQMVLVFQDYARSLFPWLTVTGNVMFPLRKRKDIAQEQKVQQAESAIKAVGLTKFANHYPWQLSGGMQQRVSIARALAFDPHLLLMDEPFGALDEIVRDKLNQQLLELWDRTGKTVVFVTHSIPEAVFLSTKIIVMSPRPGRIIDVIDTNLPRKRNLDIRETPEFLKIAHRVREGLKAGHSYED